MANLLNGWFVDRATGQGKPVTVSGTTSAANGVVGAGITAGGTPPLFLNNPPALVAAPSLLNGWFCDRAPGKGKPYLGDAGSINGPLIGDRTYPYDLPSPGGKFYFELTVGAISAGGHNLDLSGSPQFGFINATQRDTINSTVLLIQGLFGGGLTAGPPAGGRTISMGESADSAAAMYHTGNYARICGGALYGPHNDYGWHTGDIIGVAVDTINSLMWTRNWSQSSTTVMTIDWNDGANGYGPSLGTKGYDISAISGALIIWFGASGLFGDSVVLNAGAGPAGTAVAGGELYTQFYGLGGTGVIPAGFQAWDLTGATTWDASAASTTTITGFTQPFGSAARLDAILSNGGLTATISTHDAYFFGSANPYASTWVNGPYAVDGVIVMDGISTSVPSSFYWLRTTFTSGSGYSQPASGGGLIQGWAAATIGVVSNTSKARV